MRKLLETIRPKRIDYYIMGKFLGTFFLSIMLISLIVIVFDISEHIQDFIEEQAPLSAIVFGYYVNFVPYIVNLFSPLFTFVAVIFFTSKMAGNNEIIAILNGCVSFKRMMCSYIVAALTIGMMAFVLSNFVIPYTKKNEIEFKNTYIKKVIKSKDSDIHLKLSDTTYAYMEFWYVEDNNGVNFSLETMDFTHVSKKLTASRIIWHDDTKHWTLKDYVERTFLPDGTMCIRRGDELDTIIPKMTNKDFMVISSDMETMNYRELRNYIKMEKLKGSGRTKFYQIEKHKRMAIPFSTVILTVIGLSVSCRKQRGGNDTAILYGVLISSSYILFQQGTTVFATYGNMNPMLAAWFPNIVYGIICFFIVRNTPK